MNGLKLKKDSSAVKLLQRKIMGWEELNETLTEHFSAGGCLVAYLHYKVLIGKVTGGKPEFYQGETFDPKHLLKLRVFNKRQELFIWQRDEYSFQGRLRIDGYGQSRDIVEAEQVLWGTNCEPLGDGWTRLFEERGVELILPLDLEAQAMNDPQNRIKIKTRNYIGYNDLEQAGYEDYRFVEFTGGEV